MTTVKLTSRKRDILQFIFDYKERTTVSPSVREIMEGVGLKSTSATHRQLTTLHIKGYLESQISKPRTLALTPLAYEVLQTN